MVKCKLCGKKFKVISNTHLLSVHSYELKDYIKEYGFRGCGFTVTPNLLPKSNPRYKKWKESLQKRPPPWNKGLNKETHPSVAKISKTLKEKKIDNFKEWRRQAKKKGIIPTYYPPLKKDRELAFLVGMMWGDGNIHKFPRTEGLRITLGTDKPELWQHTAKIVKRVFKKQPYIYKPKNQESIIISLYQKELSRRIGIPCGNRSKIKIELPRWIRNSREFLIACLRGLYEAEGSFNIHKPTYTYKMIFTNRNDSLLCMVYDSLKALGFHPHTSQYKVQISRKEEVLKCKKLISFRENYNAGWSNR